jgi:catechol 2,3-dioxygenase-like lactoylglutathione lyase family enzyme
LIAEHLSRKLLFMVRVHLVVIRCCDLERSRGFYEVLGLRFTPHTHAGGPLHYAHETDDFVFELYPAPSAGYSDKTGLGFSVEDLADVHRRLSEAGWKPGTIGETTWGTVFVVRDPEGRRVEVKQVSREGET